MPGWEHLQDTWRKVHNRRVREHFRDFVNDPDDISGWNAFIADADINIPRQSLLLACLQDDRDNADMVILRTLLFWVVLGQASALHPPMYTMPSDRYQQSIKFAPQVTLIFKEDLEDVEEGYAPLDAEISFRIMDESSSSMTESKARTLANKIKTEFVSGGGYRWHKGRTKLSYRDKDNGYQFAVNAFSDTIGRQVINKVLDLQSHTLDLDLLSITTLGDNPPTVPPQEFIYGKARRVARKRPVGFVRFAYADLHIWGMPNPITLIDRTGRRKNPLIEV
jgi:hypothetical protein